MLGTRALQVFDDTVCVVRAATRWMEFYAHESCGKCTPCREGTAWLRATLLRVQGGQGRPEDMELLDDIPKSIIGKAFCPLGDGAPSTLISSLKYFREEYEAHIRLGACPFDPAASVLFEEVSA
jgi:NADH-quinone oxidoreductase subunit F